MDGKDKFAGAYVQDPQKGKHEWVYDLDITSMYPSIIMSLNISPETKLGKLDSWDVEPFLKGVDRTYSIKDKNGKESAKLTTGEFQNFLKDNNVSISSNGVLYRSDKKGLIPALLEKWFDTRVEYRKLMKKFGDAGDKRDPDRGWRGSDGHRWSDSAWHGGLPGGGSKTAGAVLGRQRKHRRRCAGGDGGTAAGRVGGCRAIEHAGRRGCGSATAGGAGLDQEGPAF